VPAGYARVRPQQPHACCPLGSPHHAASTARVSTGHHQMQPENSENSNPEGIRPAHVHLHAPITLLVRISGTPIVLHMEKGAPPAGRPSHLAVLLGDDGQRLWRLRLHECDRSHLGSQRWQREAGCRGPGLRHVRARHGKGKR